MSTSLPRRPRLAVLAALAPAIFVLHFLELFGREVFRSGDIRASALVAVGALSAAPMLAHGYLIVFRGSRLF